MCDLGSYIDAVSKFKIPCICTHRNVTRKDDSLEVSSCIWYWRHMESGEFAMKRTTGRLMIHFLYQIQESSKDGTLCGHFESTLRFGLRSWSRKLKAPVFRDRKAISLDLRSGSRSKMISNLDLTYSNPYSTHFLVPTGRSMLFSEPNRILYRLRQGVHVLAEAARLGKTMLVARGYKNV